MHPLMATEGVRMTKARKMHRNTFQLPSGVDALDDQCMISRLPRSNGLANLFLT